jgi:hypothetical protein
MDRRRSATKLWQVDDVMTEDVVAADPALVTKIL